MKTKNKKIYANFNQILSEKKLTDLSFFLFLSFFSLVIVFGTPSALFAEETETASTTPQTSVTSEPSTSASSTDVATPESSASTTTVSETTVLTETPTSTQITTTEQTSTEQSVSSTSQNEITSADRATLTIRIGNIVIFSNSVEIPTAITTVTDNAGAIHDIPANRVLSFITAADSATSTFSITDLAYYSSFDSFIINCIANSTESPVCYNWQYTVNDIYPYVGIDDYELKANDDVYFYFGSQNRFNLATTSAQIGDPIVVTAEKYEYRANVWSPRSGVTAGATTPDPNNPWTPIVVTSTLTNETGIANLFISATGTYQIGIGEDYYYPTETITIFEFIGSEAIPTTTVTSTAQTTESKTTADTNTNTGGGGTNSPAINSSNSVLVDVQKAVQFLSDNQNQSNGAIGSGTLYSDWAAVAFGSYSGSETAKEKLKNYLLTDPSPGTAPTDFERRAMALLALGINPYSGTKTNYIDAIMQTYKNNQFGGSGLINDDIFALIPLLKSGYTAADTEIQNSTAFILSQQNTNGGWESPDMTAAAIQALTPLQSITGVSPALAKAKEYLKTSTKSDGRIGDNSFSTSWGIQAIVALGESVDSWNQNNASPLAYLGEQQQTDGGIEQNTIPSDTRIWSTSYAVPATQKKRWSDILVSFTKPAPAENSASNSGVGGGITIPFETAPLTVPTSSVLIIATSTSDLLVLPTTTESITENIKTINNTQTEIDAAVSVPVSALTSIEGSQNESSDTSPINTKNEITLNIGDEEKNSQIPEESKNLLPDSGENIILPPPQNKPKTARAVMATSATVAASAAGYLAWRFFQSLI